LVLVINAENGQGKIIAVILSSDNRFDEMEKLITWISNSYQ